MKCLQYIHRKEKDMVSESRRNGTFVSYFSRHFHPNQLSHVGVVAVVLTLLE